MRRIGVRQFQQNFHKELKDLPFVVTKDGNDYCVVTPLTAIDDIAKVLRSDDVTTPVTTKTWVGRKDPYAYDVINGSEEETQAAREQDRCQMPNTNCKNLGYLYQVTFMTDEGEKKKDYFLCGVHLKKTRDSGNEVTEL